MSDTPANKDRAALEARIARILLQHSDADVTEQSITPDTALIDSGFALSSVELLEALVEIEHAFKVRLTDEDLTVEVLSSFALFVDHVCRLISPASGIPSPAEPVHRA